MKIEHVGIAVKDLDTAVKTYGKLLNTPCYKREVVESEKVTTAFFRVGSTKVELLSAAGSGSAIEKFLEKRGEGIHHIAFEVDDIEKELTRLADDGFSLIDEKPRKGADNKWIAFVHPKDNHGVLIELCQSTG